MRLVEPTATGKLNRQRLQRLIDELRQFRSTGEYGVEARVLLQDLRQQLVEAA